MLQKIILILLFATSSIFGVTIQDRNASTTPTTGSRVSNIPYGYYINTLQPQMMRIVGNLNLSSQNDKRFFAGYGLYDAGDNQCKWLEGGKTKYDFDQKFNKLKVYNNNSYAISRDSMTITQCKALAAEFSGEVFTPNNASENQAIIGPNSELADEEGWLGMYRMSCSSDYINMHNEQQFYKNFFESEYNCNPSKLYTYKKEESGLWFKASDQESHKCIIKISSPDVERPVKVCAPWWRIERTFKLPPQEEILINGVKLDLYSINQSPLPMRLTTCLKYADTNITTSTTEQRTVLCKTYYDMSMGPQCINDPIQDSCFVDTCTGYVKNICSLNELQPYGDDQTKDYQWGYVNIDGVPTRVQVKQNIRSHAYTCPPSSVSFNKCVQRGDVVVFPHQCDTDICSKYKDCMRKKGSDRKACYTQFPCEETYGDANQPVLENGKLVGFRGKCGNEQVVNRNINSIEQTTEKCLKYKTITDVSYINKKCTSEAKEQQYEIDTTITAEDVYQHQSQCIRMNDVENAQPKINLVFEYVNKGFFNLGIVKSYIDDSNQTSHTVNSENPIADDLQYVELKYTSSEGKGSKEVNGTTECSTKRDENWGNKRINVYAAEMNTDENATQTWSGLIGMVKADTLNVNPCRKNEVNMNGKCYLDANMDGSVDINKTSCPSSVRYTLSGDKCVAPEQYNFAIIAVAKKGYDKQQLSTNLGMGIVSSIIDMDTYDLAYLGITKEQVDSGEYVVYGGNLLPGDDILGRYKIFNYDVFDNSYIEADSQKINVTGADCNNLAKCLDFNVVSNYNNDQESAQCKISSQTTIDDEVNDNLVMTEPEYPKYKETKDTLATSLDGRNDIYSIQEYADGKFGYASNYHFPLPKNNYVAIEGKEMFPMIEQYPKDLKMRFNYFIQQYLHRTKNEEPRIQEGSYEGTSFGVKDGTSEAVIAGFASGAAVGAAAVGMGAAMGMSALYGGIAGLVVIAAIMMFSSSVKYGDMISDWQINKDINNTRYVENVYGYDWRLIDQGRNKFVFNLEKYYSPTAEDDQFANFFKNHLYYKKSNLYWQGYEKGLVDNTLIRPYENKIQPYPGKGKWYQFSWRKTKKYIDGRSEMEVNKLVNNVYLGATNTVSIFVPYSGDYEISAFSKSGQLLGSMIVKSEDFLPATATKMSHARVYFATATNFNVAPEVKDGTIDGACKYDNEAEWGGGVSGVYFEEGTPEGNICDKSNDNYVQTNYASYLLIQPIKANKPFRINLIKPMPYANRFFLVTYGKKENRKYTCYEKGEPCSPESASTSY
ncbi:hypothetical protein [Aquamicrobium sp.]|uniref:hypothetical protein n=1 Tax=Aquamicrobium sp. TaxID=1872579 RepID=UPI002590F516|nr:hypothetical protein [Aquamicrobium sp.]MCK9549465.1 hypothetical protein [Aquamicrobium sp.]